MSLGSELAGKLAEKTAEDRRLTILQALAEDSDGEINEDLLSRVLDEMGRGASADAIRADLMHLKMQVCVMTREAGDLWIAKITRHGCDVALGKAQARGVARPTPWSAG